MGWPEADAVAEPLVGTGRGRGTAQRAPAGGQCQQPEHHGGAGPLLSENALKRSLRAAGGVRKLPPVFKVFPYMQIRGEQVDSPAL
jgi:hypothetical protein